jgi:hypothetical protein
MLSKLASSALREVMSMSLLRLFLMGWLSVGIVVLAFLFWLCKHTPIKEVDSFPDTETQSREPRAA